MLTLGVVPEEFSEFGVELLKRTGGCKPVKKIVGAKSLKNGANYLQERILEFILKKGRKSPRMKLHAFSRCIAA